MVWIAPDGQTRIIQTLSVGLQAQRMVRAGDRFADVSPGEWDYPSMEGELEIFEACILALLASKTGG